MEPKDLYCRLCGYEAGTLTDDHNRARSHFPAKIEVYDRNRATFTDTSGGLASIDPTLGDGGESLQKAKNPRKTKAGHSEGQQDIIVFIMDGSYRCTTKTANATGRSWKGHLLVEHV